MKIDEVVERYITEAKSDYEINHKTYTSAIEEITTYVKKNGYTLDDETDKEDIGNQMYDKVGSGPRKPTGGKTNRFSFDLYKNNKIQKKKLHAQVYGDEGRFELNMYIS